MELSRGLDLGEFDAVLIHWSLVIISDSYLAPPFIEKIRGFSGPKLLMIQDDYRGVDRMIKRMKELKIDVLFTLVPPREIPKIFSADRLPGVRTKTYLAGYVPEHLLHRPASPLAEREMDLVYRGRELPYWLGRLGQEKAQIAKGVAERAERYSLKVDVAFREGERIYGEDWIRFISSSRATLGTESGATITDFDGSIEQGVRQYLSEHPEASFEEVHDAVLAPFEGNVRMNVLSPRVFEAASLRTALVLFPGEYSGILEPDRHYIPLQKDFSNLGEVASKLRDTEELQAMVDRTYREIACAEAYSLRRLVRDVDETVEAVPTFRPRARYPYRLQIARVERAFRASAMVRAAKQAYRMALALATFWRHPNLVLPVLRAIAGGRVPLAKVPKLAADLIRFRLLASALAGRPPGEVSFSVGLSHDPPGRTAILTSYPGPPKALVLDDRGVFDGKALVWNHGLIGNGLTFAGRSSLHNIGLGDDGKYVFDVLSLVGPEPGRVLATGVMERLARP